MTPYERKRARRLARELRELLRSAEEAGNGRAARPPSGVWLELREYHRARREWAETASRSAHDYYGCLIGPETAQAFATRCLDQAEEKAFAWGAALRRRVDQHAAGE